MIPQPKDTYRVQCPFDFSNGVVQRLVLLYLPLVGNLAFSLYMTLAAESFGVNAQQTHDRLFGLLGNPVDKDFDAACARLEEYRLLRIFQKNISKRSAYFYMLDKPLTADNFRHASTLTRSYVEYMGSHNYENTLARLLAGPPPLSDYQEITRASVNNERVIPEDKVNYVSVKPQYDFGRQEEISFDYDRFLATTTALVFPIELRTKENMSLIGRLATVYGLSADTMRMIVKECVNLSNLSLNTTELYRRCEKATSDVPATEDPYAMDPKSFLQSRQHGAMVTMADKKLLEMLAIDMHFPNPVINIMVEHILAISSNRLIPNFVQQIAGEWARDGITTKEQALLKTKQQVRQTQKKARQPLPSYMVEQQQGYKDTKKVDPKKLEKYRQMIKENTSNDE